MYNYWLAISLLIDLWIGPWSFRDFSPNVNLLVRIWDTIFPLQYGAYIFSCHLIVFHVHILNAAGSPICLHVRGNYWHPVKCASAPGGYEVVFLVNSLNHLSSLETMSVKSVLVSSGASPIYIEVLEQKFLFDMRPDSNHLVWITYYKSTKLKVPFFSFFLSVFLLVCKVFV